MGIKLTPENLIVSKVYAIDVGVLHNNCERLTLIFYDAFCGNTMSLQTLRLLLPLILLRPVHLTLNSPTSRSSKKPLR